MACERRLKSLSRVAAGDSADAGLQRHLEECAACRAHLNAAREALATVDGVLQDLSRVAPGEGFSRRVRRAAGRRGTASPVWLPWAAAAAGVAALGLLARPLFLPDAPGRAAGEIRDVRRTDVPADPRAEAIGDEAAADAGPGARPLAAPAAVRVRSPEAPRRATRRSPAEVRVPAGQLQALVRYARLRQVDDRVVASGASDAPLGALDPDSIRVDPLSVEPLSFDAEGASR